MAENTTQPTQVDPADFVAGVQHPTRRADAETLLDLMTRITGYQAKMWGPTMVGFGTYQYRYESGREGEFLITGFSPRKANTTVYVLPGYEDLSEELSRLGKHKLGRSCLYINKLADVDLDVLAEIVTKGVAHMEANYDTSA